MCLGEFWLGKFPVLLHVLVSHLTRVQAQVSPLFHSPATGPSCYRPRPLKVNPGFAFPLFCAVVALGSVPLWQEPQMCKVNGEEGEGRRKERGEIEMGRAIPNLP